MNQEMRPNEEFSPLQVVKKSLLDANRTAYRVYKSHSEFVTVDATTALEAYREAGIKRPVRIVREMRFMDRLVDQSKFSEVDDIIETVGLRMEAPDGISPHNEPVPQAPAAAAPAQQHASEEVATEVAAEPETEVVPPPAASEEAPVEAAAEEEKEKEKESDLSAEDVSALLGEEKPAEEASSQEAEAAGDALSEDDIDALLNDKEE